MKRAQINRHRLTWFILPLIMAATVFGALYVKPPADAELNQTLPPALSEGSR